MNAQIYTETLCLSTTTMKGIGCEMKINSPQIFLLGIESEIHIFMVSHSGLMVSKHGLYVGGLVSIPTTATTSRTDVGGDAEHVSLNFTDLIHHTKV